MAIKTRISPVEKTLSVIISSALSPKARSEELAGFARGKLAEAQAQNKAVLGSVPNHETYVDGRRGGALESVKPDGSIIFEFELYDEMLEWISDLLLLNSPVGEQTDKRPGHPTLYARSHLIVVDGQEHKLGDPIPPTATELFIANAVPYARKIERGLSAQAPDGVYQVVAKLASDRFGNLAKIRFGYRSIAVGGIDAWARAAAGQGKGRGAHRRARREDLARQPAVIVTFK